MERRRLNSFQKSMVQWDQMHPYNAVHVVQMRGAPDLHRLRASISAAVNRRGLARLTLDGEQLTFAHEAGPEEQEHDQDQEQEQQQEHDERLTFRHEAGPADCDLQIVAGREGARAALATEMERQLNLRFDHEQPFNPFRFLVAPAGDSFFLGVVYFHPVADAESVVGLLHEIATRYTQEAGSGVGADVDLYPSSRGHLLGRHPLMAARRCLALPAKIRRLRQSHRPNYRDADNMANGFQCDALQADELRLLLDGAKSWRVTVNDLLLALLMKGLSPAAAGRFRERRRRNISLGCIVNLRHDLGLENPPAFGVFLGSFTVSHEAPEEISLRQLAEEIRDQTAAIKRHKSYLGTPLELGLARRVMRFFSPRRQRKFYAKNYPLWGGITNMNLHSLWKAEGGYAPLDYFRGVSTGPVTPLVLSATTVGERMNLGWSYRTTVFSKDDLDRLQARFREHLQETRRER
jgi:NRPS condensation-like uncharacterized protein